MNRILSGLGHRAGSEYHKSQFVAGCGQHRFAGLLGDGQTPTHAISYAFDAVFCTLNDELAVNLFEIFDFRASFASVGMG